MTAYTIAALAAAASLVADRRARMAQAAERRSLRAFIAMQEQVILAQSEILEQQAADLHALRCELDGALDLSLQCLQSIPW